ncbi:hypothetical protein LGK97_09575 [Clostridium sp. CS001]|uniref:hypothetical protein n=1 Tax=Clostridium sp. CS001 TaxID=2880648 RepID=UPI001CF3E76F|nr:hypothetical protein [Clostridium sp. CS001]MCB2290016.1 hypothetical protein [Clostridium sp. CS001]
MRRKNVIAMLLFSALFLGSISLCFFNNNKIKDNKSKTESLKIELESLKSENEALIKTNSKLIETNTRISEKVNSLKTVTN